MRCLSELKSCAFENLSFRSIEWVRLPSRLGIAHTGGHQGSRPSGQGEARTKGESPAGLVDHITVAARTAIVVVSPYRFDGAPGGIIVGLSIRKLEQEHNGKGGALLGV